MNHLFWAHHCYFPIKLPCVGEGPPNIVWGQHHKARALRKDESPRRHAGDSGT